MEDDFEDLPPEPWKYGIIDDRILWPHLWPRLGLTLPEASPEEAATGDAPPVVESETPSDDERSAESDAPDGAKPPVV